MTYVSELFEGECRGDIGRHRWRKNYFQFISLKFCAFDKHHPSFSSVNRERYDPPGLRLTAFDDLCYAPCAFLHVASQVDRQSKRAWTRVHMKRETVPKSSYSASGIYRPAIGEV